MPLVFISKLTNQHQTLSQTVVTCHCTLDQPPRYTYMKIHVHSTLAYERIQVHHTELSSPVH